MVGLLPSVGHLGKRKAAIIQPGTYIIRQVTEWRRNCQDSNNCSLTILLMPFKDIFSSPTIMVQVCNRAFTNFYHNHLGIQIHHAHKGHTLEPECIESSSGPARTHACLEGSKPAIVGPRVEHKDEFTCKGGVDARRLVNLARKGLYSTAKEMGGNVLVIRWDCEIRHPRYQHRDQFKVTVSNPFCVN